MLIKKRNGKIVDFNKNKIIYAIDRAFIEVDGELFETDTAEDIALEIEEKVKNSSSIKDVEFIQDQIEDYLINSERKDVAKAYIKYRYLHNLARNDYKELMDTVKIKISAKNVVNQNANVDENSFGGRIGEASDAVMKKYALDYCVSPMSKSNHLENMIYIHDLNSYPVGSHNCLSIPFDHLLANGFNTRQTSVRPANSVNTAFQLVAVIFQLQSLQQFGGVSATHLDWTMVPYVRKSFYKHFKDGMKYIQGQPIYDKDGTQLPYKGANKEDEELSRYNDSMSILASEYKWYPNAFGYAWDMTKKEVRQAVEGMFHNLNTLQSRSGNQLPFTSINYGTCTLPEGRMIIKAILDCSIKGIGKNYKTSIFPCQIFQCMKGVNRQPGEPNYDLYQLALKSTAKRLYPNYANVDWSGNEGYDPKDPTTYFSTMGCRTANGWDVNGLGQQKDGRGNICPVTIILPTLAMMAKEEYEKPIKVDNENNVNLEILFLRLLNQKIDEAKDMLIERFEWICSQKSESAKFMYENGLMAGYIPEEGIRSALKHGTLAIGQLGLAETLQILIGCDHTEKKGMELAKRIEKIFKDKCAYFKKEYKLNFGVYYTPAENLCYTAMQKFKDKYGIIPNVSDKEFFTNSMHVPVWHKINPFTKIDIESELTGYSSAGCITYVELDSDVRNNLEGLEKIVNYAMDKDIPYFAINVPSDTCLDCNYQGYIENNCPECGSGHIERLRRVTGYLTGNYTTAFNKGKQDEVEKRVKHDKELLEV